MGYDVDLFVIGAGSGGVRAARFAGSLGASVIVAESGPLGGTCVNVGCVPKKLLVYASQYADVQQDAAGFGWGFSRPSFDWAELIRRKDAEILRLNGIYEGLLERTGVRIVRGHARLVDAHTVAVGNETFTAERILIATGGTPYRPSIPGAELGWVSDDLFVLPSLPERVVVVGGGYIAVEFAGILNALGSQVCLLVRGPALLRGFDCDVQSHLLTELQTRGVDVRLESEVTAIEMSDEGLSVQISSGQRLEVNALMWATGRVPNTQNLGLEAAGVATASNGTIVVEGPDFQTSVPHIHAVGDVIGTAALTPVALAQGMAFAKRTYGGAKDVVSYNNIATAVFSQPNVATVGLTEAEARAQGEVVIFRSAFRAMKHTLTGRQERSLMKLVVCKTTDRVLGCHMVGPDAGEIVQGLAIAMNAGATKAVFDATIGIHPTAAEEFVTMRTPVSED